MANPVRLPRLPVKWDEFRVAYRDGWNNGSGWTNAPQWSDSSIAGVRVKSFSRKALPEVGEAILEAPFGVIDNQEVLVNLGGESGNLPSSENIYTELPDLLKKVIRIQARRGVPGDSNPNPWHTVFIGEARFQIDEDMPGASSRTYGIRRWRCVDLLYAFLSQYPLDRHAYQVTSGETHADCEGHPGYNLSGDDGIVLGNLGSTDTVSVAGQDVSTFALPGSEYADKWSDFGVLQHALDSRRKTGDPLFAIRSADGVIAGGTAVIEAGLSSGNIYEVEPDTTAWDIVTQVLRRQRGLGAAFLDWDDDDSNASTMPDIGSGKIYIRVMPQTLNDINITGATDIKGATSKGTTTTVTLVGDYRYVDQSLNIDQRDDARVDYLETVGEQIEVVATFSYEDNTLKEGWTTGEATNYKNADSGARIADEFMHVYRRHQLATATANIFQAGDGNGGGNARWSYRCADDGTVSAPSTTDFSMMQVRIMPDTPFQVGYDYSTNPATQTGEGAETQQRRLPIVAVRTGADTYADLSDQVSIRLGQTTIQIESPNDLAGGTSARYLGDTTASIGSTYDYDQLVLTMSLQLPTRLRRASGDSTSPRRKRIYQPGLHLWIQHTKCIHDFDGDGDGTDVLRFPSSSFEKIRDDADELEIKHLLAWEWYGGDHRAASWELKCCGLLPDFSEGYRFDPNLEVSGTQTTYPTLGQYVTDLWHSGRTVDVEASNDNILYTTLNTVVTSIEYDNDRGITRWSTDWTDLDFGG